MKYIITLFSKNYEDQYWEINEKQNLTCKDLISKLRELENYFIEHDDKIVIKATNDSY